MEWFLYSAFLLKNTNTTFLIHIRAFFILTVTHMDAPCLWIFGMQRGGDAIEPLTF